MSSNLWFLPSSNEWFVKNLIGYKNPVTLKMNFWPSYPMLACVYMFCDFLWAENLLLI